VTAAVQLVAMALVAVFGTALVLTTEPKRQVIVSGPFSLSLIVLLTVLQAPDVVLSAVVVGLIGYPVMVLFALAKINSHQVEE